MTAVDQRGTGAGQGSASSPARIVSWRREALVLGTLYLVFELLRDLVPTRTALADDHALDVLAVERMLHLDIEDAVQRAALAVPWTVDAANAFYASAYVVVTLTALVWMARRHHAGYAFWRNALVVTTCLGLVGYYLYPTAPPRLLADAGPGAGFGIVDTLRSLPGPWSLQAPLVSSIGNSYAAMPSLHCAWATWVALVVVLNARDRTLRTLASGYAFATAVVVLVTGNHFVLDVLAGVAVALVGVGLAWTWEHRHELAARVAARPDPPGATVAKPAETVTLRG